MRTSGWKPVVLILAVSLLGMLLGATPAVAQYWPNGYSYRSTITIDHTKVPNTDQTNFPVLISGTYSNLATVANGGSVANANGHDIVFTSDTNGLNLLPFEQESYNPSTGAILYWVKLPTASHTADTVFYLFYGNSSIVTDQSNKTAVWDGNYQGVWHLPNGSSLAATDSTSNGNNGTITGSTATGGLMDGAASFSGSGQYIDVGNQPSLQITGNAITLETWVKTSEVNPAQYERILVKETPGNADPYAVYVLCRLAGSNGVDFGIATGGAGSAVGVQSVSSLTMGAWTHVVGTYDGSNLKIYLNGNLENQVSETGNIASTSQNVVLGADTAARIEYLNGSIDEARISNIARSADWIATEYHNQSSPSTFHAVGTSAQGPIPFLITGLSPSVADFGASVIIEGTNFGSTQGNSTVSLNGTNLAIQAWSNSQIEVSIPYGASSGYFMVTINGQTAISPILTVTPLAAGWSHGDIGSVGVAGSATYSNGTFTVKGAGSSIGGTADSMHFVYQPLSGDGTIVARVATVQGAFPQAGVMIRETLDAGSANALVEFQPNQAFLSYRSSAGAGTSAPATFFGAPSFPYWTKLTRTGNVFSGYISLDGVNWTQVATSQTITMAQNVYIGLAVSSQYITATFDNVSVSTSSSPAPVISGVSATTGSIGGQVVISGSGFGATQNGSLVTLNATPVTINSWNATSIIITIPAGATSGLLVVSVGPSVNNSNPVYFVVTAQPLPTGWLDQDIGSVGVGSATYTNRVFTVNGAGFDIGNTADGMHFVYQPLSGDGTILARVVTLQGSFPQAGVMIRETMDPGSTNAFVYFQPNQAFFAYRSSSGSSAASQTVFFAAPATPYWTMVTRSGNVFTGYISLDGVYWTQAGPSATITMAQNVYVGMAVSPTSLTATFDNALVIAGTPPPTPAITGITPSSGGPGFSVTITGSSFGATQGNSSVLFNGSPALSISSWSDTQIVAFVPLTATTGPLTVVANNLGSNQNFIFTFYSPVITSVVPPAAPVGGTVVVSGSGFGVLGQSTVQFNGVATNIGTQTNTSFPVVVPANATSGPITVTTGNVTSNGVPFTVLEPLSISGISTTFGPAGTSVTISGAGFGPSQSDSVVTFYTTSASVSSWSDTQIVTTVPSGAATGAVSVQVADVNAFGPIFTVTSTLQLIDSLNNQTNYTSALVGGIWVVSSSQGSGCSSCTLRGQVGYTYDSNGNVLSRTDELGRTTTYTYDSNGNELSISVPTGSGTYATTSYTYNSFGEVLTTTDPLGNVTTNTYDAKGNLLTVTTPAPSGGSSGSVTTFTYDSKGELLTITDPLSHATSITYFPTGLINTITDAQSNVTTYAYDSHGNRTSVTDALNHTTTFAYDTGDRLKTITYPDTTTTTFAYDTRGRRTGVTDQNGKTTAYAYDDADRLTSVTDAASNVTAYGYDTENNLTSITDAKNHATSFAYDAFGRVTKTTFPSTFYETYAYDAVGNLTSKIDRNNHAVTYTYDQLNRLTQKSYPDSTSVNYAYDNDSRLTQVTDPTGTYAFTFDNMGRLTNTTTSYAFLTGRNFTTAYGFDAASNRSSFTDPESGATAYVFDTLNRLQTLTPPAAYGGGSFGFGYDALSRRTSLTRPNALNTTYSYDNLSRLLSVTHAKSGTTLDGASHTLDNAGNRTSRTPLPGTATTNYTYDAIYELLTAKQGTNTTESYTYDPVGNRLSSLVSSYTTNSSNELTAKSGVTYTYDNNGNTLTKVDSTGTTTYTWDFENRLTSVALPGSGGTVSFKYDPFGRRIYKSSSAGTSIYVYDNYNQIEETTGSGTVVARYVQQSLNIDEPLATLRSGATSFYQADGLGSVTSLSNAAGALAQTYTFDSFGSQTASSGSLTNSFRYTARELDAETGLYYYRARYYDSSTGRFLSEDPARYEFTSFYSYVGNNSVLWTDPLGLWKCKQGDCGRLNPALKDSLDGFEKCTGLNLTVTCGTSGHEPTISKSGVAKGDPHYWGTAVDIGHNTNPGLSREIFGRCFKQFFPQKYPDGTGWGSYAQQEYNSSNPDDGWHFHVQYFGGATGGAGLAPGIHPHGQ
jgi:RHS repeat-associated protein